MKKQTQNTLALSIAILSGSLLTGCGGVDGISLDGNNNDSNASNDDDGGDDNNKFKSTATYNAFTGLAEGTSINARFVDGVVESLQYKSTSNSGTTNVNGGFICASGEVVEFVIGSLSLGTSICQGIVTPQTLAAKKIPKEVPTTTTSVSGYTTTAGIKVVNEAQPVNYNAPEVTNRVRLLMSMDTDSVEAGIQLPAAIEQAKVTTTSLNFADTTSFETNALAVLQAMTPTANRSLVQTVDAEAHFKASLDGLNDPNYDLQTGSHIDKAQVAIAQQTAAQTSNDRDNDEDEDHDDDHDDDH